jgi:hypothetical protein
MVMGKVQVGASSGEVGYQASTIAKIDFPQPPQLKTTEAFLGQEDWKNALAEIRPVVKYYEAFRDLPGNWWAQAALLEVSALGGMQLDKEAETLGDVVLFLNMIGFQAFWGLLMTDLPHDYPTISGRLSMFARAGHAQIAGDCNHRRHESA